MTTVLMPLPKQQYLSILGTPLAGGKVYTYSAGTNNPKATYTDTAGTIPQTNPIILNARGEPDNPIYWSGNYKVAVYDALNNLIYTADNFNTDPAGVWSFITNLATSVGASLIGWVQSGIGAVVRTIQDKLRERVSVMDFGAVGDGLTVDRAAIQAAIDAVNTTYVATGKEGIVEIPPGIYIVDAVNYIPDGGGVQGITSLVMRDGVHIRGKGIIKVKSGAYGPGAFYRCFSSRDVTRLSNASICDITIDGNSANQTASVQCSNTVLECLTNVSVVGVKSLNANGNGIMLRGTTASLATSLLVQGCTVSGATSIGIQSSQFSSVRIIGNDVSGCTDNSIDVYGEDGTANCHGKSFTITGNVIFGGLVGVFCETVRDGVVSSNSISNCTAIGVVVNRINGQPRDILISNNNITATPTCARVTGDTGGIRIANNIFDSYSTSGVDLGIGGGNCSYVDISNNFFTPSTNTVATIRTQGNTISFCTGANNVVNSNGIAEGLLFFKAATTHVSTRMDSFRVIPGQVGADLSAALARLDVLQLNMGSASNTAGPIDVTIPDNTAGDLHIWAYQGGTGMVKSRQPYIKRAGILSLGALITDVTVTVTPVSSVTNVGNNVRISLSAANSNISYGLQYLAIF